MLSIVMDKSAKEKYFAVQESRKALKEKKKGAATPIVEPAAIEPDAKQEPSMDRQELIRNALAVHKEQSKVFANLNENERRRLQLLAMHAMLGKDAS